MTHIINKNRKTVTNLLKSGEGVFYSYLQLVKIVNGG